MGTIGERLQHARKRAGLSIADLSARTKIRATLLEAIEREDFARLPPGLLTRGFLRAYAREVHLDPDSVVRQFQAEFEPDAPHTAVVTVGAAAGQTRAHASDRRRTSRPPAVSGAAAAAVAGVLFLAFHAGFRTSEPNGEASPASIGTMGAIHPSAAGGGDVGPAAAAAVDAVVASTVESFRDDALTVEIAAAGQVWVEATADGTQLLYRLLQPGEHAAIGVHEELTLRVGDAGAFQYSINGVPGVPLGPPAAVRVLHITSANYATFQVSAQAVEEAPAGGQVMP